MYRIKSNVRAAASSFGVMASMVQAGANSRHLFDIGVAGALSCYITKEEVRPKAVKASQTFS